MVEHKIRVGGSDRVRDWCPGPVMHPRCLAPVSQQDLIPAASVGGQRASGVVCPGDKACPDCPSLP